MKKSEITFEDLNLAMKEARDRAEKVLKQMGISYLIVENDKIYSLNPDGSREYIKEVEFKMKNIQNLKSK